MAVSYKKLRIKMAELNINMSDIKNNTGLSWGSLTNINKDEYVNLKTIEIIANYLQCNIGDLVEIKKDSTLK